MAPTTFTGRPETSETSLDWICGEFRTPKARGAGGPTDKCLTSPILRSGGEPPSLASFAEESTAWPMVSRPLYVGGLGVGLKLGPPLAIKTAASTDAKPGVDTDLIALASCRWRRANSCFLNLDEREQSVRSALAKMESGFIRRLAEVHRA